VEYFWTHYSAGGKMVGREVNHSAPPCAKVKNVLPSYVFMVWCLIKQEMHLLDVLLS